MQRTRLTIIAALPLVVAGVAVAQASPSSSDCPELFASRPESRIPEQHDPQQIVAAARVAEANALMRPLSAKRLDKPPSRAEQAISLDPQHASAWCLLAGAHRQSQRYLSVRKSVALSRAWAALAAGRALATGIVEGRFLLADQAFLATSDCRRGRHIRETAGRLALDNALRLPADAASGVRAEAIRRARRPDEARRQASLSRLAGRKRRARVRRADRAATSRRFGEAHRACHADGSGVAS